MPSQETQQFSRRVSALSHVVESGAYSAQTVVETILVLWSTALHPRLSCAGLACPKKLASAPEVQDFVDWLGKHEYLSAAYWLSSGYAQWAGREYRKSMAMFFTPPSITNRLLDGLAQTGVSFEKDSFFDPACGGAAFLAPIAQRIRTALRARGATSRQILDHVSQKLFGVDLDAVLCRLSRHYLRMALAEEIYEAQFEPTFFISEADSLFDVSPLLGTMDVVVCNPPYRKMQTDEVAMCRDGFGHVIEGQPNIYGLFMVQCLQFLRPQGLAALVTPTSFMSGRSFSKLRSHLMENSEILHIGIVANRTGVFIDVEQETALTMFRQRQPEHAAETTIDVAIVSKEGELESVGICVLPNSGSVWPVPRTEGDIALLQFSGSSAYRLADYGYRPRIGALVWNRDKRRTFHSLTEANAADATLVVPLLWSSDIRQDGKLAFTDKAKANGEPSFVEVANLDHPPVFARQAVILQRVTSNDQPRRLIAAVVPESLLNLYGGFVGENHTVILEATDGCDFPPDLLVALLSVSAIDRYFRCISGVTNVSVFELLQLPLPSPIHLRAGLAQGLGMDAAVAWAFERSAID